jgi:hypothetical protein
MSAPGGVLSLAEAARSLLDANTYYENGGNPWFIALRGALNRETEGECDDYREILYDLCMLQAQRDIGCVPPPTADQWTKAWARAWEKFEP